MSFGEVAEAKDAARALHDPRSLGYAREEKRLYEPTGEGIQLHASLERARRQALRASMSSLGADERRELAEAVSKLPQRYPCVRDRSSTSARNPDPRPTVSNETEEVAR